MSKSKSGHHQKVQKLNKQNINKKEKQKKMSFKKLAVSFLTILTLSACMDVKWQRFMVIKCYSGSSTPVFEDESIGMARDTEEGAGIHYRSAKTGKYTRVYMDCVVVDK